MFLTVLKFGIGLLFGTSGLLGVFVVLFAFSEWVKKWWSRESEHGWQQSADGPVHLREMAAPDRLTIAHREKVLVMLRYPSEDGAGSESSNRSSWYVQ